MTIKRKVVAFILWFRPMQHWSGAISAIFLLGAVFAIIAVVTGIGISKSPSDTVDQLYQAAQDSNIEAFRGVLTQDGKAQFDKLSPDQVSALLSALTKGHTEKGTDSLGLKLYGNNAVVGVMENFTDGSPDVRVEVLSREGSHWRVQWPVGASSDWVQTNQRFDPLYH